MSNELVPLLPAAWTVEVQYSSYGYGDRYGQALPYSNHDHMMRTIVERGIKIPFEAVVSRCDGFSVCKQCGARYAGQADRCVATVWKKKGYYNWDHAKPGDFSDRYAQLEMRVCDSNNFDWSHHAEFSAQQEFFSFVSLIASLPERYESQIKKYEDCLPAGAAHEYRLLAIEKAHLEFEMRVSEAMRTIAQKMNNAGQSLCF